LKALAASDLARDGVLNGDTLAGAFHQVLDQAYLGGRQGSSREVLASVGLNETTQTGFLDKLKDLKFPGIPPGVDITNIQNIGRCPMFKGAVTGQVSINEPK